MKGRDDMAPRHTSNPPRIAGLPAEIREEINRQLGDGKFYRDVVVWLRENGYTDISRDMVWRWFHGPHQEWLLERELAAEPSRKEEA
jgi:hypothetical protein